MPATEEKPATFAYAGVTEAETPVVGLDIETAPLDDADDPIPFDVWNAARGKPWYPTAPTPFDRSSVKIGNLKDPDKIEAKIAAAEEKHAGWTATLAEDNELGREHALGQWRRGRTLDPFRGRVLSVASSRSGRTIVRDDGEAALLLMAWDIVERAIDGSIILATANGHDFDLRWLRIRSQILGIGVPRGIRGAYWNHDWHHDVCREDADGPQKPSLDALARAYLGESKPDLCLRLPHEVHAEDRDRFLEYAEWDADATRRIAERQMGRRGA